MKVDLGTDFVLLNINVDEITRLFQCATDAGIWTREEAKRYETRLELIRAKLNADFRDLVDLRERAKASRRGRQNTNRYTTK
jgi:hypothetical protein